FNKPADTEAAASTPATTVMPNDVKVGKEPIDLAASEQPASNLWTFNGDDSSWDTPAFLRKKDDSKKSGAAKFADKFLHRHKENEPKVEDKPSANPVAEKDQTAAETDAAKDDDKTQPKPSKDSDKTDDKS
ncbi:hypothetical protein HY346_02870, partial [Candidatus Microgenomates bacterium]|nr:hypothetical protein [Candidatus Microgenomates bacterium]